MKWGCDVYTGEDLLVLLLRLSLLNQQWHPQLNELDELTQVLPPGQLKLVRLELKRLGL